MYDRFSAPLINDEKGFLYLWGIYKYEYINMKRIKLI